MKIMKKQANITLTDIAKHAGVSIASVSRVINNSSKVSPSLRAKVKNAIDELNFKPLEKRRKDDFSAPYRIGLLTPDISDEMQTKVVKGVLEISNTVNMQVVLYDYENDIAKETACLKEMLESGLEGIISILSLDKINPMYMELIAQNFPLVMVIHSLYPKCLDNDLIGNVNIVRTDDIEGTYNASKYLLNLGHKKILYLGDPNINRFIGYERALTESSIKIDSNLILDCENTYENAYLLIRKTYEYIRYTSIVAVSDNVALGSYNALKDLGLNIPQDCSIIGYSDSKLASFFSLTTIAEPLQEIGKNALFLLHNTIKGLQAVPKQLLLRNSLIIRNSCTKI